MNIDIHPTGDPDRYSFRCVTGGTALSGRIIWTDKGLAISKITVEAADVTGSLLRKVRYGEILLRAQSVIPPMAPAPSPASQPLGPSSGGRTPRTDGFLREVAGMCLRGGAPGQPRGVSRRMAEHYGRPEDTIRTWIGRARKRGWLGPAKPGRLGVAPGPRLLGAKQCGTCHGAPPPNFACNDCGTGTPTPQPPTET